MSRKSVIICSIVALFLIVGIAVSVMVLYSGTPGEDTKIEKMQVYSGAEQFAELLAAIPVDAAAVVMLSDAEAGKDLLPESVLRGAFGRFTATLPGKVVESLHNSGSLTPLAVVKDFDGLDMMAAEAGLACEETQSGDLAVAIISPSESLVNLAVRQLATGESLLDRADFNSACALAQSDNTILVSNQYSGKMLSAYFGGSFSKYEPFVEKCARWIVLSLKNSTVSSVSLKGDCCTTESEEWFLDVFEGLPSGESLVSDVIPGTATWAVDLVFKNFKSYRKAYQRFLDSCGKLPEYLKNSGDAARWAEENDLVEAAVVSWSSIDGNTYSAAFARLGKSEESGSDGDYNAEGYLCTLLGQAFKIPDETCSVRSGDWVVSGSKAALNDWVSCGKGIDRLSKKDCKFLILSDDRLLVCGKNGFELTEDTGTEIRTSKVEIPQGPFEVTNCATGKTNFFYQNENNYLCLKDESGKGLWGVPFSSSLCGRACNIDYFKNGKIQFLFASGSAFYAIDRLGRFVSGFPVELGRNVLIGPDVYDFSGKRDYNAVVLHTDNSVEIYNLQGKKMEGWKGIRLDELIEDIPALVDKDGKKCWEVRTAKQVYVFPFEGGDYLSVKKK